MTITALIAVVIGFWFGVLLANISLHILMSEPKDVHIGTVVFLNAGYWAMVMLTVAAGYGLLKTFVLG